MGRGDWIVARARAAVLAAAIFAIVTPAKADSPSCNLFDLGNALLNAAGALTSSQCETAFADPAGAGIVTGLAGVLAGVLAANQQTGDQLCNAINNGINVQNDAGSVAGLIDSYFPGQGLGSAVQTTLGTFAGPLAAASCACSVDQGLSQLGGDALSCIQAGICALQEAIFNQPCSCTPQLPHSASNCSPPAWCANSAANENNSECQGAIIGAPSNPPQFIEQSSPGGTLVLDVMGSCGGNVYCFCPSPMTLQKWQNWWQGSDPLNGTASTWYYSCQCPPGTSASPDNPNVCICNGSSIVATPPDSAGIICHVLTGKTCGPGQENVNGKCVTPCADPSQIQLASGTCCNPAQAAACGECCPSGQAPDPVMGNCKPTLHENPGPVRPLPGPIR